MKQPSIYEFRTFAMIQSNALKTHYGSGVVGAGFKDVYTDFKKVRGKFEQKTGSRELTDGSIARIARYEYTIRFENAIMQMLDLQTRFVINSITYTLNSWSYLEEGKERYFIFDLSEYGK